MAMVCATPESQIGATMRCLRVAASEVAHPTGDPNFSVMQAFPAAVPAEEADPFLMCDELGPKVSTGRASHPDEFPVNWHQHIGMDIMTYLKEGRGRHADSLGNRSEFASPGFQWCSVGSGIEHAEGGGTPAGSAMHGFQIWVNVPRTHKHDDPRYGTESPENIPVIEMPGVHILLLAGEHNGKVGPFRTVQNVQMADIMIEPRFQHTHSVPDDMDNCMVYVYRGEGVICGQRVREKEIACLNAQDPAARNLVIQAGDGGVGAMLFAGRRIREEIVWRGGLVVSSRQELKDAITDMQKGRFPPKQAPWDYKRFAAFPADKRKEIELNS